MAEVCIVVPTYNESENISKLIDQLEGLGKNFRVIVVDDNSPDGTAGIVEDLAKKWGNIDLQRRPGKLGIGSAIRDGMERALSYADCRYVVTMDADLSHNPQDVPRLVKAAQEGDAGLIQGSRYIRGGSIIGWNFNRKLQSRIANLFAKIIFGLPNEVTTYFRVYTRESAQLVVENARTDKNEFALESAVLIKDHGFRIIETPVIFVNRTRGKSKLKPSDVLVWLGFAMKLSISRRRIKGRVKQFSRSSSHLT